MTGLYPVIASNGAMGIVTSQLFDAYWRNREAGWCGTKISDLLDS